MPGPLVVGKAWWSPENGGPGVFSDQWFGNVDNVEVYQGAMNAVQVADRYAS